MEKKNMITNFEKEMLKKSLDFLNSKNTEPIDLGKLQTIINHASEEFSSLDEIKFKYIIENPDNNDLIILGITTFSFIKELNVLSFRSDKIQEPFKVISKKPLIQEGILSSTLNLKDIQKIIDSVKDIENWGSILICIENLFFPNMYCIGNDNSVYVKLGEN
jgi:hypothetical protein